MQGPCYNLFLYLNKVFLIFRIRRLIKHVNMFIFVYKFMFDPLYILKSQILLYS